MADERKKNCRSSNWSEEEVNLLVDLVSSSNSLVTGKFSSSVRKCDKAEFWRNATEQINAVGGQERTKVQVYKKWADLKRYAKKVESNKRKSQHMTGGGPCCTESSSAVHEKIIGTIPVCCIDGISDTDEISITDNHLTDDNSNTTLNRTENEKFFAQAIERTIMETVEQQACSSDDCSVEKGSLKNKSSKKRQAKGNDDVADLILDLEMKQLEELKRINQNLTVLNNNILSLVKMHTSQLCDDSMCDEIITHLI